MIYNKKSKKEKVYSDARGKKTVSYYECNIRDGVKRVKKVLASKYPGKR